MFLLSAKKSIKKQYIFPCICKIDMMNFIRNIIGGKIAHQSLQETIIGLLYGIMQVTYEDHGAKIAKYFQKKINRIDEVYFCTCIYIQYTQDICVNNYQLKMKLL